MSSTSCCCFLPSPPKHDINRPSCTPWLLYWLPLSLPPLFLSPLFLSPTLALRSFFFHCLVMYCRWFLVLKIFMLLGNSPLMWKNRRSGSKFPQRWWSRTAKMLSLLCQHVVTGRPCVNSWLFSLCFPVGCTLSTKHLSLQNLTLVSVYYTVCKAIQHPF